MKIDHCDVSSKKLLVYKQMKFVLKMIIGCHPELWFITHGIRCCVRESVRTRGAWFMVSPISFHGMVCRIPYRIDMFLLECEDENVE